MMPIEGVSIVQGDLTDPNISKLILRLMSNDHDAAAAEMGSLQADVVLCDGAPDVTGLHAVDAFVQSGLLTCVLDLTVAILRPGTGTNFFSVLLLQILILIFILNPFRLLGGTFVAKIFTTSDLGLLETQLAQVFDKVDVAKPESSRAASMEAFVVCR